MLRGDIFKSRFLQYTCPLFFSSSASFPLFLSPSTSFSLSPYLSLSLSLSLSIIVVFALTGCWPM